MTFLVSIVMPSLNQAAFIEQAIASVLQQDYQRLELVVADGGSDDGTVDVLERLQRSDERLRWFSGKDQGPANALNKALAGVRGTVIGWLNSDDVYTPGAIDRAVEALDAEPTWLMVYGHGEHIDAAGNVLGLYTSRSPDTPVAGFADGCFICQPTVFFNRSMGLLLGPLDETLKTAFDFDYWLRAFKQFPGRIGFVDAVQAQSRLHAACITLNMRRTVALEGLKVVYRHLSLAPAHWLFNYANELGTGKAQLAAGMSFRELMEQTLMEAGQFLTPSDLAGLRSALSSCFAQER